MRIEVSTQADLDKLLKKGIKPGDNIILIGNEWFHIDGNTHVEAWGSAHVEARGSAHVVARGSAHVEARGSAHVVARESAHVEAWGSAHVEARGSAHVVARESAHVVAWGSAHVEARGSAHVVARESAHVVARGSARVEASKFVAVHKQPGHNGKLTGGVVITVELPTTVEDWCAYYGASVTDGIALLYKGVNEDYRSPRGLLYAPGTTPEAPDWDGGKAECGGGLHFSPTPLATLQFHDSAKRFLACPVALADIRKPDPNDQYPNKVKARRVAGPIVEVDRYGAAIQVEARS